MRWITFVIFAYLALALETGLRTLWGVHTGVGDVSPSLLMVLAVFVAVWTPAASVPWAMLALGALADLRPVESGAVTGAILGPSALGYLIGGYFVLRLRAMLYRDSALALAVMTFAAGLVMHLVAVLILSLRALPWPAAWPLGGAPAGWGVADELSRRFLELLYTAVVAFPVGWLLLRYQGLWGFAGSKASRR